MRRGGLEEPVSGDRKIFFLSNYPPKECGIATFTKDLVTSMNRRFNPKLKSRVIALNDPEGHYRYDSRVLLQFNRDDPEDFVRMAKQVNENDEIQLVCIQHEFGLYGGNYGENVLRFLENLEKPAAVTFHSVLPYPDFERRQIVRSIAAYSAAIIVMAEAAVNILNRDYGIEKSKIHVIHHGTPNAKFASPDQYKKKIGLEGRTVILTFGLLSVNKGIEYMIKALPSLVKKYPDILYLVLGETHPNIRMHEGEEYRNKLVDLVKNLNLEDHVKFYNKYVSTEELVDPYILACDIFAFTNIEKDQITSGTLAYALACGRPIVSTPVIYAKELLEHDRGIVISDTKRPDLFTEALDKLLGDGELRKNMSEAAYAFGRQMIWSNVAARHLNVFNRIVQLREEITKKYPAIKLEHLKNLTDGFACLQFANGSQPDKNSGYTVDDNARALMISVLHNSLFDSKISYDLSFTYLDFLEHAQTKDGDFVNVFKSKKEPLQEFSEDALGRAVWSLGFSSEKSTDKKIVDKADKLFRKSFEKVKDLNSPRAKAFAMLGLFSHYKKYGDKKDTDLIKNFADSLVELYKEHASNEWTWFENILTYSNAQLPEALFLAYDLLKDEKYLEVAESTLHFLSEIVFVNDELVPIGQNGWYNKEGKRAFFDQQPIDAAAMVHAYLSAYYVTGDKYYYERAVLSFNWFLGRNHLNQMVYNETNGGCYDGLGKQSVNLNQGAESTISYLMPRLLLEEMKRK
ncbi:MAG: glycosyltransferase [Nanoarchaeota archaeon]